jgi:hypothetical protein
MLLIALAMDWKDSLKDLDTPDSLSDEIKSEFTLKWW